MGSAPGDGKTRAFTIARSATTGAPKPTDRETAAANDAS
jgi:hypothetical protein